MADSFGEMWRELRLHCPFVPVPLAQRWIRDRYRRMLSRSLWGGTVAQAQFLIPDAYSTGSILATNGSATVLGVGTSFNASHVGQQLLVGGVGPFYTILAVPDALTLTLDQLYGGTTFAGSFTIAQVYLTPAADFLSLKVVIDPINNWKLRINVTQEYLDSIDAQRTYSGQPRIIADYRFGPTGIPMFEIWPRSLVQAQFPYLYYKTGADLVADADVPLFPIRGDAIKMGALADLARWPGVEDRRNPMFDLRLAAMYDAQYEEIAKTIDVEDQEIYQTMVTFPDTGFDNYPWAPFDTNWLQVHDTFY